MSIRFACAACRIGLRVPEGAAGRKARCPACAAVTRTPVLVRPGAALSASAASRVPLDPSAIPSVPDESAVEEAPGG
jgi:hypothetical protein